MTTKKNSPQQTFIWSIDPFEEKSETRSHIVKSITELVKNGARIEPVYILSPNEYEIDLAFNSPWLKQAQPTAQKVVDHYIKDLGLTGLAPPQVVIESKPSLVDAVRALSHYAVKRKADAVLVGTHAKKGLPRLFLGSFAETLLLHARIPVLVVGPHSETAKHNRILFATDFGTSSASVFRKVLALAKARNAKMTLFHCLPHPLEPYLQSSVYLLGGGALSFPDYLTKNEQKKRKEALKYAAIAKKAGIELEIDFNSGHKSTSQAIVNRAEQKKFALIALAAESGPVSAALVGSIARQVVRSAPCPVWVLRAN